MQATLNFAGRAWRVDVSRSWDVSIPLDFNGAQPSFFGAPRATATALRAGDFTGSVAAGAGCNCATYALTPHCNGTHTESAGHVTAELRSVHELVREPLLPAYVLSVAVAPAATVAEQDLVTAAGDLLVSAEALARARAGHSLADVRALIVRTHPNPLAKRYWQYGAQQPAPYFTAAAMRWIVALGIEHLIVDVPSLDRSDDGGRLLCHRVFWGMAARGSTDTRIERPHATVTEMAYIPDEVSDGPYALNLQIAPFLADAAPSRPLLYPVVPP